MLTLHNAQIMYAHIAFPNNLIAERTVPRLVRILRLILCAVTKHLAATFCHLYSGLASEPTT